MNKYTYECKRCSRFGEHTIGHEGEKKIGCKIIDCDHSYPIKTNRDNTIIRCREYDPIFEEQPSSVA